MSESPIPSCVLSIPSLNLHGEGCGSSALWGHRDYLLLPALKDPITRVNM